MTALVKKNHQRRGIGRQGKSLDVFRNGEGVSLGAGRRRNFDVDGNVEDANMTFDFLRLLDRQRHLMLGIVVAVAQVELWSAGAIGPLVEKEIHADMVDFFD